MPPAVEAPMEMGMDGAAVHGGEGEHALDESAVFDMGELDGGEAALNGTPAEPAEGVHQTTDEEAAHPLDNNKKPDPSEEAIAVGLLRWWSLNEMNE